MKIGLFTDSHYSSEHPYAIYRIKHALRYFEDVRCELAVFLGDLVDTELTYEENVKKLREIKNLFDRCTFPVFVITGNHDALVFSIDNFYEILGRERCPRTYTKDGVALVFLDTCHYKNGDDYRVGVRDFSEAYFHRINELSDTLAALDTARTYIFTHHPLDPAATPHRRISNADAILAMIEKSGNIKSVFQGHDHRRIESVIGETRFVTFPALVDDAEAFFVEEL